jgi:exodeoxyribonuclease VII small subunit
MENNMSETTQANLENLTFEQAYQALTETVEKLEAGNLPLEEALSLYQQGMALAKFCNQQLDTAELRISVLSPSGELVEFDEA